MTNNYFELSYLSREEVETALAESHKRNIELNSLKAELEQAKAALSTAQRDGAVKAFRRFVDDVLDGQADGGYTRKVFLRAITERADQIERREIEV